ncbi:hypothetical protein [Endozoicomonas sp. SCSIO W0465]|uniref:hypothetical protein n=1 Tax=Endozoicomonas sp. SCSIO W0465 TaxID=2918516 RepID=UPI00207652F2|nr:hypothetical protein [Endozoicomonas sp. SCSIO W0465]USE35472.1 hypothetical protein MJO57_25800 [Endozoicomonas sp. SCSIO W0465]
METINQVFAMQDQTAISSCTHQRPSQQPSQQPSVVQHEGRPVTKSLNQDLMVNGQYPADYSNKPGSRNDDGSFREVALLTDPGNIFRGDAGATPALRADNKHSLADSKSCRDFHGQYSRNVQLALWVHGYMTLPKWKSLPALKALPNNENPLMSTLSTPATSATPDTSHEPASQLGYSQYRISESEKTSPTSSLAPLMIQPENPNHLVKRDNWVQYGNPNTFNAGFRAFVNIAKESIIQKELTVKTLIESAIEVREKIEIIRNHEKAHEFGLRRYDPKSMQNYHKKYLHTPLYCKAYSCGNKRAVELDHNEYFINEATDEGKGFIRFLALIGAYPSEIDEIHHGVVVGNAGNEKVYLTQILTSPRICKYEVESFFGRFDDNYVGNEKRSALLVHTDPHQLDRGLRHVQGLIEQAMAGDLSVIPRIHWWYVHLAPTVRGPGGTVEMIIHALCAANGYYLPGWTNDIAPSIEILVEPDEDAFCQNYHKLFEAHQDALQMLFTKKKE